MARDGRNGNSKTKVSVTKHIRVAVYTRKSINQGLDQEFNTLDAQRQAIEAIIESQRGEGWVALPEKYDDGGFTGANTKRPAFQRLLQDIKDDKVDAVAIYKLDRLSRSLTDFANIIDYFDRYGVSFTSITQQFNSATSMGKLTLNILMSFAEFERQVIAERTRDKMAATRMRGMWTGGRPVLGFDVEEKKLVVNDEEAGQVREIYDLYLKLGSLLTVVQELNRRKLKNKTHVTKSGKVFPGADFEKNSVRRILTNALYLGKVEFNGEMYDGEHQRIVDQKTWDAVQRQLEEHRRATGNGGKNAVTAILKGLVRCGMCGSPLTHASTKRRDRRYRYYDCQKRHKNGSSSCPNSRVSAPKLEGFVVEQIMAIGKDPKLVSKTVRAARKALEKQKAELSPEAKRLDRESKKLADEKKNLLDALGKGDAGKKPVMERLDEIESSLQKLNQKAEAARKDLVSLQDTAIDEEDLKAALESFTPVWSELSPRKQSRILHLLIEQVTYDAQEGKVQISFRPGGVRSLAAENEEKEQ